MPMKITERPRKPSPQYPAISIDRVNNGYVVHTSNPHRAPVCGGDMWVFETRAALNKWMAKHFRQPEGA